MDSRAKRNHNPGNLRYGAFARKWGATGQDREGFARFASTRQGTLALVDLLFTRTYGRLSLARALERYAPPRENPTQDYLDFVSAKSGVAPDQVLDHLSPAQHLRIAAAMSEFEGWY